MILNVQNFQIKITRNQLLIFYRGIIGARSDYTEQYCQYIDKILFHVIYFHSDELNCKL
jgi:hypothetical protein